MRKAPAMHAGLMSLVLASAWLLVAPAQAAQAPQAGTAHPPGAAIASAHQLSTDAGLEILGQGGNAFDAAIAVSSTLSVVEPISSGIGGGGFFLLHDAKSGRDVFVDARETAPAAATPAAYLDKNGELDRDRATNGPWSAGIPGLPAALVHLAERYGKLPLKTSLAPAIRIAREGFPIYPRLEKGYASRREVMERYAGTRAVFLADGSPPKAGEILKQPELAHTLELLAGKGYDGFYRGEVAKKLLAAVKHEGGQWRADELSGYQVREREPLRLKYRGWDIVTAPPPSSGGVALAEILQMLSGWDLSKLDDAHRVHIVAEAMRRAYRDRTLYLGDPDFVKVPLARLTSADYAAGLRATIHPDKATPSDLLSGTPAPLEDDETTHFSIIDAEGNRVAATQTVNLLYGSGMVAPGTGVLLNNEMDDFALRPGTPNAFGVMGFSANAPAPGKRMLSSMTPSFLESKDKVIAVGAPGGSRIITQVLLAILAYDAGLAPQQVAALPRYHHQWMPDAISAEAGALDAATVSALQAMGHKVNAGEASWGNLQTVMWDKAAGTLSGGTDPRNPVGKAAVLAQP
ncbi:MULTISPECIES: gamma-glutamyltransferase [unclassified Lysobacter]|uniref:gamma-glutamyltransferase n=1 Tax=unclassified Lysobacter TaxID=2635362 RepID=UPI0006FF7D4D|nr:MULTISPECIES: gamma-glutamyltransferase [unclassified Lysobacter]KRA15420.1 gamma-glutamyltransferase [Lysobacter sp. Root604]KRD80332.1 gamma-glutamyltransferase [Lysobacter sp. Root983]